VSATKKRERFERLMLPHLSAAHNYARWLVGARAERFRDMTPSLDVVLQAANGLSTLVPGVDVGSVRSRLEW